MEVTDIFINDNGNEFVNLITEDLYERTGVQQCTTSPYHPQANGLVERVNRTNNRQTQNYDTQTSRLGRCFTDSCLGSQINLPCIYKLWTSQDHAWT